MCACVCVRACVCARNFRRHKIPHSLITMSVYVCGRVGGARACVCVCVQVRTCQHAWVPFI